MSGIVSPWDSGVRCPKCKSPDTYISGRSGYPGERDLVCFRCGYYCYQSDYKFGDGYKRIIVISETDLEYLRKKGIHHDNNCIIQTEEYKESPDKTPIDEKLEKMFWSKELNDYVKNNDTHKVEKEDK